MTIKAEVALVIARPPGAVFAELTAVERYPEWLVASGVVGVERPDGGDVLAVGSRLVVQVAVAGQSATLEGRITVLEPGQRLAFEAEEAQGLRLAADATIIADGEGSSVRWTLRLDLPGRYRGLGAFVTPQVRRAAALDMDRFKARLETARPA